MIGLYIHACLERRDVKDAAVWLRPERVEGLIEVMAKEVSQSGGVCRGVRGVLHSSHFSIQKLLWKSDRALINLFSTVPGFLSHSLRNKSMNKNGGNLVRHIL